MSICESLRYCSDNITEVMELKIREIVIHNYRSIEEATIRTGDYSLLIGQNNSGKSNMIDAIRTFYEKDIKFEYERDFPKFSTADQESWIEIEYELSEEEAHTIREEYLMTNRCIRLRKWFYPPDKAKQGVVAYEHGKLSNNSFYGWKSVAQGKMGNVIYIPAASRLEDHTKFTGPSALRDLVVDILTSVLASSDAFHELRGAFSRFSRKIKEEVTPDQRSISQLESRINAEIEDWGVRFTLDVTSPDEGDIVRNLLRHALRDSDLAVEMSPEAFGHGLQRHLIFTLIRVAASYSTRLQSLRQKGGFSPDLDLLLFEEPEAFLHPPQQDALDTSLRRLAARQNCQVIAVTHSPLFVSCNTDDLVNLIRVRRDSGKTRVAQVSKAQLQQIFEDNQRIREVLSFSGKGNGESIELEAVRHFLWLNPERSSMFFANYVLIVEGLSEQVLINHFIKTGKLSGGKGLFVLNAEGKYNIHRFMNLLGALGIEHAVLHDEDSGSKQHEQHECLNKLIRETKNEFTRAIDTFRTNLEDFLGYCADNERWKKAAQIFAAVLRNQISEDRIDAFIDKVRALVKQLDCCENPLCNS